MTLGERLLITFKKSQVVKIRRYWKDRRTTINYAIPDKYDTVTIGKRAYVIDPENVYYEKGIPTYSYNTDDPTAAPVILEFESWKPSSISTLDFQAVKEEMISAHILQGMEQKMSVQMLLIICTVLIIMGMAGGFFFIYDLLSKMEVSYFG